MSSKHHNIHPRRFKDVPQMMYGFGDVSDPLEDSVQVVEELALIFMTDLAAKASAVSTRRDQIAAEDVLFVVRKDPKKFFRGREALDFQRKKDKVEEDAKKDVTAVARYGKDQKQ